VKAGTLHRSDFVKQNAANTKTNKLPLWPFWDKNHLTGKKYNAGPNQKLPPIFVTKGQRVKPSNEQNHKIITPPQCLRSTRVNRVIISTDKNFLKSKTIGK
jgi:hypothetical protein